MLLNSNTKAAVYCSPARIMEMNEELELRLCYQFDERPCIACRASVTSSTGVHDICVDSPWYIFRVFVISAPNVHDIFVGCPWCLCRASVTSFSGVRDICVERPCCLRRAFVTSLPNVRDVFVDHLCHLCPLARIRRTASEHCLDIFINISGIHFNAFL